MFDKREFLAKRRNRAIATILGFKENECDDYLPSDVSDDLRLVILDNINDVVDLAFDLMSEDIAFNELFLDKMKEFVEKST